jgi:outer membrane protein assembly factor BamA
VGAFVGDRAVIASIELRIPVSSPLSFARLGGTLFYDAAKAYDAGQRSSATPWSSGAGAGAFMTLRFLSLNVHFAHSLNGTGNRIHLSTGFTF